MLQGSEIISEQPPTYIVKITRQFCFLVSRCQWGYLDFYSCAYNCLSYPPTPPCLILCPNIYGYGMVLNSFPYPGVLIPPLFLLKHIRRFFIFFHVDLLLSSTIPLICLEHTMKFFIMVSYVTLKGYHEGISSFDMNVCIHILTRWRIIISKVSLTVMVK